jgi:hypothetical protein
MYTSLDGPASELRTSVSICILNDSIRNYRVRFFADIACTAC